MRLIYNKVSAEVCNQFFIF